MASTHSFVVRVTDAAGVTDDQTITVALADKPASPSFFFGSSASYLSSQRMACASCGCKDFELCVTQGDGYLIADGRGVCITSAGCSWPAGLTNVKLILESRSGGCGCPWPGDPVICGTITGSNGRYSACFQMTSEQTHSLQIGRFQYNLRLVAETLHGAVVTLRHGKLTVQ